MLRWARQEAPRLSRVSRRTIAQRSPSISRCFDFVGNVSAMGRHSITLPWWSVLCKRLCVPWPSVTALSSILPLAQLPHQSHHHQITVVVYTNDSAHRSSGHSAVSFPPALPKLGMSATRLTPIPPVLSHWPVTPVAHARSWSPLQHIAFKVLCK